MKSEVLFIPLVLLAASLVGKLEARRCYKCTSTNSGPCFEPGENNATTETCAPSSEEFSCSTTRIVLGSNGDVIVKRECLRTMLTDQFCAEFEDEGLNGQNKYLTAECTVCDDSDLCNSSGKITLSILTSSLMCTFILYKLL